MSKNATDKKWWKEYTTCDTTTAGYVDAALNAAKAAIEGAGKNAVGGDAEDNLISALMRYYSDSANTYTYRS